MVDVELELGLSDLEIPEESLEELAQKAMGLARVLENNPRTVTEEDAYNIYQDAY